MEGTTTRNYFLYEYIRSLKERSRLEKTGYKNGLDWLIVQLGIQKGWLPVRIPFSIDADQNLKTKSEGELGIDVSFLSKDRETLYIFVLKDEKLNNSNWTNAGFGTDIRKASTPNMKSKELNKVQSIIIITAYNKDEDRNGVALYDNLVDNLPSTIGRASEYQCEFERWNLTKIVEEIGEHLLTPELLPNDLTSQFRYICSQISNFDYCSKEWLNQLEPNWKNYTESVLGDVVNPNSVNLLVLSIYIIKDYWKSDEKSYAGWIDLIEWAMLSLWRHYYGLGDGAKDNRIKTQICSVWSMVYLAELETYLIVVDPVLRIQHGLSLGNLPFDMKFVPINDSFRAFWHMGRLGILNAAIQELDFGDDTETVVRNRIVKTAELLVTFLQANPSASRPLIDLHHIELFLVWLILYQGGKAGVVHEWLSELENVLVVRKYVKSISLPFVQSSNDFDAVVEYMNSDREESESEEYSSYLILMLVELCFSIKNQKHRDTLVERYVNRLCEGILGGEGDPDKRREDRQSRIDLVSWNPPEDWEKKLLFGSLIGEGVGITTSNFTLHDQKRPSTLSERIELFVQKVRHKFPYEGPQKLPISVCILACIKHKSPLPPEFWRGTVFPKK